MSVLDIYELLDNILSFITPDNAVELAEFRRLRTVNKLWNSVIINLETRHLARTWYTKHPSIESLEEWLFNSTTDYPANAPRPNDAEFEDFVSSYNEDYYFDFDELHCSFAEIIDSIGFPDQEMKICSIYPEFGSRKPIQLSIVAKTVIDDDKVEFSINVRNHEFAGGFIRSIRLQWDRNTSDVVLISTIGEPFNPDKLITSLFNDGINYKGERIMPYHDWPIDILCFNSDVIKIRNLSVSGDVNLRLVSQDKKSYSFELCEITEEKQTQTVTFQWIPDSGVVLITSESEQTSVRFIIKDLFAFDVHVIDDLSRI